MQLKLNEDAVILLEALKAEGKVILSTKIKGQNGKIFLSTLELDRDQVDIVIAELVTLRSNLTNNV